MQLDFHEHDQVLQTLEKSIRSGSSAHAYMLHAAGGIGGLKLAHAVAEVLLLNKSTQPDVHTEMIRKLEHPDLHFIYPLVGVNKKNQSSDFIETWRSAYLENPYLTLNSWVLQQAGDPNKRPKYYKTEAEAIHKKASLKSYTGAGKVMILWMPELLQDAVANKLLKLVEEPPAGMYFLMVSEDPSSVLPTILSRTQVIKVPSPSISSVQEKLVAQGIDEESARIVAEATDGSLGVALENVTNEEDLSSLLAAFRELLRASFQFKLGLITDWASEHASLKREKLKLLIDIGLQSMRKSLYTNLGLEVALATYEKDFVTKFAPFLTGEFLDEAYPAINRAHYELDRNGNAKMVMTNLGIQLAIALSKTKKKAKAAS